MQLLRETLSSEVPELNKNNVRLNAIGRLDGLPESVQAALRKSLSDTAGNSGLLLNLALNYGGRSELVDAFRHLVAAVEQGQLRPQDIDEETISSALYTAGLPDPDLLIRSSGEMRLSNFLTWQTVYTEIWVTSVYWPDFRRQHLYEAIRTYQHRHRRFGGA
jgi:undecaprenyl diphosphate synthase